MVISFLSIALPQSEAMERFKGWMDRKEIRAPRTVNYLRAVEEATEDDEWLGAAFLVYEVDSGTIFEDLSGPISGVSAEQWLKLAQKDELEFIGYNEAVPYGRIIVIREGRIIRDFFHNEQDPTDDRNIGRFEFDDHTELETWKDAAYYVDTVMDGIDLPDEGVLWIFEAPEWD
jgi:hypothetical protein